MVSGKRPQAGATGKCQHPTPGPIRAKETVPLSAAPPPGMEEAPGTRAPDTSTEAEARRDGGLGTPHRVCCEGGRIMLVGPRRVWASRGSLHPPPWW